MAATAILAAGTTQASSSVVSLADSASANIVIFAPTGSIPQSAIFEVKIQTSASNPTLFKRLTGGEWTVKVNGPGDYIVDRLATGGVSLGIDKN